MCFAHILCGYIYIYIHIQIYFICGLFCSFVSLIGATSQPSPVASKGLEWSSRRMSSGGNKASGNCPGSPPETIFPKMSLASLTTQSWQEGEGKLYIYICIYVFSS